MAWGMGLLRLDPPELAALGGKLRSFRCWHARAPPVHLRAAAVSPMSVPAWRHFAAASNVGRRILPLLQRSVFGQSSCRIACHRYKWINRKSSVFVKVSTERSIGSGLNSLGFWANLSSVACSYQTPFMLEVSMELQFGSNCSVNALKSADVRMVLFKSSK